MKYFLFLLLFFNFSPVFSQTDSDLQLAQHYYGKRSFDKALEYYEKIYNEAPTLTIFKKYYECLIETKNYKRAEKTLKKEISKTKNDLDLKLQLAGFYVDRNDESRANKIYENLLSNKTNSPSQCIALFNSFITLNELGEAKRVLELGKKKFKSYPFNFQEADLYAQQQDKSKMIESYLSLLESHDYYNESVQKALLRRLDLETEESNEFMLLKTALFERARKENSGVVFSEMLIWQYSQVDNFAGVYNQVVAVDIRSKANGLRLFDFALVCRENKDYKTAIRAFQETKSTTNSKELK
jgi:tetratricopeptide (TPR) repeat protein